ncbi:MAG TPA: hypothetical protein VNZ58_05605 [Thermomicrobiales bacterium]|nr:hypothetical protein [Thermomicrobiales bacterium]
MSLNKFTRRRFNATAAGFAAGVFASSRFGASAQDATPAGGVTPLGYVSTRIRTVATAEQRVRVNELVRDDFAPDVEALPGFQGYALADVIDVPEDSLSILVLEEASQTEGFLDLAKDFVSGISDEVQTVDTVGWDGDLLILGKPETSGSTPIASPAGSQAASGYVTMRVHTSLPGTDPRDFVPLATSDFLPIVSGLDGFRGYLWYPTEGGFVAISLFDTEESAQESNEAAMGWAIDFLAEYTDGKPMVVNATMAYENLPILR